jgi:hypothetical protein
MWSDHGYPSVGHFAFGPEEIQYVDKAYDDALSARSA